MAYFVDRTVKMTWWERSYLPAIIKGMYITSRHFFINLFGFVPFFLGQKKEREIFTLYYPEEMHDMPIAYRGRPVLAINENNLPNCVACGLCEAACPAYCIDIIPGENSGKQNEVERWPKEFTIDYAVCIFCGNCEEACPEEAIFMSEFYYSKADFISPFYKIYEMGLMKKFENLGIPIQLWTVNDLVFLKDLINSDIQSIVTDVSEELFQTHQNSKNV